MPTGTPALPRITRADATLGALANFENEPPNGGRQAARAACRSTAQLRHRATAIPPHQLEPPEDEPPKLEPPENELLLEKLEPPENDEKLVELVEVLEE